MVPSLYYLNNNFHNHHESNSKIIKQARALKQRIQKDSEKYDEQFRIGIEIEICLLDSESKTVNAQSLIEELKEKSTRSIMSMVPVNLNSEPSQRIWTISLSSNTFFEQFIDYIDKRVQKVYKDRETYILFS